MNAPSVIGQGGWGQFKFLFSGGNGILYAVNPQGQLLFYRDTTQNGTGDVNTPSVIGQGGWGQFKFLFSGGNGISTLSTSKDSFSFIATTTWTEPAMSIRPGHRPRRMGRFHIPVLRRKRHHLRRRPAGTPPVLSRPQHEEPATSTHPRLSGLADGPIFSLFFPAAAASFMRRKRR